MAVTRLTCRSCEAKLKVSAEPGTSVKCPRCGKSTRVPEPEPEDDFEVVDEEEEEPAPKKRSEAIKPKNGKAPTTKSKRPRDEEEQEEPEDDFEEVDDDEPAPKKRRDAITSKAANAKSAALSTSRRSRAADDDEDEEEEEERPRKRGKKKEKAGSPALLWIGIGGGGLVLVAAVVLIILLLLPGKEKAGPAKPAPGGPGPIAQPKGFLSPQEVFDAHKDALNRKDAKVAVDCLDPESRREELRRFLYQYVWLRTQAGEVGVVNSMKATYAALDKHGMTAEATKAIQFKPFPGEQERDQIGNSLLGMVKDQDGLLIDLSNALYQDIPKGNEQVGVQSVLKDVKIEGNKATGTVVNSVNNVPLGNEMMDFVKTDEGWKISFSKDKQAKAQGGPPRQP